MKPGFKFKDKHTNDFGVTAQTQSRPIRPETKSQTYETPLTDGEYDFSDANMHGREFYNNRVFKIDLKVIADNLTALQKKLSKLAAWFMGKGDLTFDDTPTVKWDAHIVDTVEYKPEHGKSAVLSVLFKVKAFARLVFNVFEGPCLDDDILLDDDIPLDTSVYFTFTGEGNHSHTVMNIGEAAVRPVITISGVSGAVNIGCNGHTLTVPGNCTVDCEHQLVTYDGVSLMSSTSGTFFELAPGANVLTLSKTATIEISYEPMYLHDADLSEVDWNE